MDGALSSLLLIVAARALSKTRACQKLMLVSLASRWKHLAEGRVPTLLYAPESEPKGLAKLGNIVAETVLRMQMFPNLAVRETCCGNKFCCSENKKCFCHGVKNIFASRAQMLCSKDRFPSLATPVNITRNIVSATMFPSLARPLRSLISRGWRFESKRFDRASSKIWMLALRYYEFLYRLTVEIWPCCQLFWFHIIVFHFPSDTAPNFLQKLHLWFFFFFAAKQATNWSGNFVTNGQQVWETINDCMSLL